MKINLKTLVVLVAALFMAAGISLQVEAADLDRAQGLLLDETSISGNFDYATTEFIIAYLTTSGTALPGGPGGATDDGTPRPGYGSDNPGSGP